MRSRIWLLPAAMLGALNGTLVRAQGTQVAQDAVPVTLVGVSAEGIKVTRPARDMSEPFRIVRTDAARSNLDVEISVPDLLGPNTNPAPVTILVGGQIITGKATVPPDGSVLTLRATLTDVTTYTSQIKIAVANKKPLIVPLQIVRQRVATTVEVKDLDAASGETGSPLVAAFSLRETSGQKSQLYMPQLSGFVRIVATKRIEVSTFETPTVSSADPGVTSQVSTADGTLDILPGATRHFNIAVKGLDEAGEYGATLHVTSPDGGTVDQAVTLLVHDSPYLAMALIVVGVILSMFIRWYYQSKRPQIVRSHTALEVLKQLGAMTTRPGLSDDAKSVVRSLEARVQGAYQRVQIGDDEGERIVTDVKSKLDLLALWLDATAVVDALGPSSIAPPLRSKMDGVRVTLLSQNPAATEISSAAAIVRAIPADIKAALSADFESARTAIESALAKRPAGSGHSPGVQQPIAEITALVDQAKRAANGGRLTDARALISKARMQYVAVLADELQQSVVAVPLGFEGDWAQIAADIRRVLDAARNDADADRAWREYNEARRLYIGCVLRGLAHESVELTGIVDARKAKDPNNQALIKSSALLTSAGASIASAQAAIGTDVDAAFDRAQDADRTIREVRTTLQSLGENMGTTGGAIADFFRAAAGLPAVASVESIDALAPLSETPAIRLRQLEQSLRAWDVLVSVIIAVAAVALGMKTLWFGSPTWGGYADWATALLWGLGLHQVSFDGLNSVVQKFSR